jgi:hypothetical protein
MNRNMKNNCLHFFYKLSFTIILFIFLALLFGLYPPWYSNFLKHLFFGVVIFQISFSGILIFFDVGLRKITQEPIGNHILIIATLLFSLLFSSSIDFINEIVNNTSLIEQSEEILIDILGTVLTFLVYLGIYIFFKKRCKWKLYWNK